MKFGISGAVGIGKTTFIEKMDILKTTPVKETAREVARMYPNAELTSFREKVWEVSIAGEKIIDRLTSKENHFVFDRTVVDNAVFFLNAGIGREKLAALKRLYDTKELAPYDIIYYFDYDRITDFNLFEKMISDPLRQKTIAGHTELNAFLKFNDAFKKTFFNIAGLLNLKIVYIKANYDVPSLERRNELTTEIIAQTVGKESACV